MQDRPDRQRVAIPNRSSTPSPLDKRWFVHIDAKTYGPYSGREIGKFAQDGRITGSDFVCPEGASAWIEARNEPTLGSLFRPRDAVPQPRATATAGAAARMHDQMRGLSSALEKQAGTAGGKPWWKRFRYDPRPLFQRADQESFRQGLHDFFGPRADKYLAVYDRMRAANKAYVYSLSGSV